MRVLVYEGDVRRILVRLGWVGRRIDGWGCG